MSDAITVWRSRRENGPEWRLLPTLLLSMLLFGAGAVHANAEERNPPQPALAAKDIATADSTRVVQAGDTYDFDIPSQPVGDALDAFIRVTGWQVGYSAELARDRRSAPVSGTLTPPDALRQLLAGTGLVYRLTAANTVTLEQATANGNGPARLNPITVDAVLEGTLTNSYNAPDNFASTRTDTPTIDTPQSTQAVTRQALDDAGATDVADAYDFLAGINRENNFGGLLGDAYLARGFATDNILINGNRSGTPTTLDTANVERIEAIRGPTATLFGRADPGGLVNIVTKQPLSKPFHEVELSGGAGFFGDGARYRDIRATVDTSGPIDEAGRVRYRLNMATEYEQSFRQDIDGTLIFLSPVVDVNLDSKTAANLELTYQYRRQVFDRGVFFINGGLPLPRDWYVGEEQAPHYHSHYGSGTFRIDRELSDAVTARLGLYASIADTDGPGIEQISLGGSQAAARRVDFNASEFVVTAQPELVAEIATGPVGHTLLFGGDFSYQKNTSKVGRGPSGTPFDAFNPGFPVDAPSTDLSLIGSVLGDSDFRAYSIGLYAEDQIDLSEHWKLLAGLRWDSVWLRSESTTSFNVGTIVSSDRRDDFNDNAFLPRIGIVYQPVKQIGLYSSYSETYRPPIGGALTDAEGNQVDPEEGRNFEIGAKLEALDGKLGGTLAVFRADKKNVIEADSVDPTAVTNLGEVRSQGVEFDLSGEVVENFSLGVTYAFIDARIRGNANPNLPDGTRLRNVPRHAASLQAAYGFPDGALKGVRVFGAVVYEDRKPATTSAANSAILPSFVRFDLGASYEFTENVQAQLLIRNLTDTAYYTSAATANRVAVGQPFNAALGVRVRF